MVRHLFLTMPILFPYRLFLVLLTYESICFPFLPPECILIKITKFATKMYAFLDFGRTRRPK